MNRLLMALIAAMLLVPNASFAQQAPQPSSLPQFASLLVIGAVLLFIVWRLGKTQQFTLIGAIAGAVLGYPLSYFFQPGALRAKFSLGQYIEHSSEVIKTKDLQSSVVLGFLVAVALGAAAGWAFGRNQRGNQ